VKHPAVERKTPSTTERSGESILADALTEYYAGQFDTAESDLQRYLQQYPGSALAQFYLGVSRLTRYYIAPEKSRPPELLAQAQAAFRTAKQSAGFTPPEKYVSPKILQVYAATTP
jgi:outer membrane protein assembly factor BamD (BamD/ComL family)